MNFSEAAAAFRKVADHCEESLALDAVKAMTAAYIPVLQGVTPVLSGDLRRSEYPDFVAGNGVYAQASAGPHIIYDRFRNDGGTITSKGPWPLRNKATGQVFGRHVTQAGSHYMERGRDAAEGPCRAAARAVADRYLTLTAASLPLAA